MSLTPEQRTQMEQLYAQHNHGFHSAYIQGIDISNLSMADYEQLWQQKFSDYLKSQGIPNYDQARSDVRTASRLESILGFYASRDYSGNLYDFVMDAVYDKSFGELLTQKSELIDYFKTEDQEITSDFEENYGSKKQQFLDATGYTSSDGDEKGYFFRFWRYPVSKLFDYRHIDLTTSEGQESAEKILTALFGVNAKNYQPQDLMNDTPEHLVEEKANIEQRQREAQRAKAQEQERLMDQPFYETLVFSGLSFADTTDTDSVAQSAYHQPLAHQKLSEYVRSDDPFDEEIFKTVITLSPRQIQSQSNALKQDLLLRTDNLFLSANPDATLEQFLSERRGKASPSGAEDDRLKAREALKQILGTTYSVDDKAVQDCLGQKCSDLTANAPAIIQNISKRKRKRLAMIISLTTTLSVLSLWGLYKATQSVTDGITALGEKTADYAKKVTTHTSSDKSADSTPSTQTSDSTALQKLTGNRPVLGFYWKGWHDKACQKEEPLAFQLVMTGEFNHILNQIKKTNLTFNNFFNPDHVTKRVMGAGTEWQPEVVDGQTPVRFYIATEGKNADAQQNKLNKENLTKDLLNYYFNMQDVLNNLPVSDTHLAENQALAMEAIGPTIGWSIHQQLSWAQKNAEQSRAALAEITKGAQGILKAQKANTSDIEAVFRATCLSVKSYRESHPEIQSYLLLADKTIRQIAGIEMQDLNQFAHFKPADMQQATFHIEKAERDMYGASKSNQKQQPTKPVKKGYPWGWIMGTAAVTIWLTSAIMMDKKKIIR